MNLYTYSKVSGFAIPALLKRYDTIYHYMADVKAGGTKVVSALTKFICCRNRKERVNWVLIHQIGFSIWDTSLHDASKPLSRPERPAESKEKSMTQAKQGDTVNVHYTGKLEDGTIFDSSRSRNPLRFTIGKGQVITGFEQAVIGMSLGETKTARIPVNQAYGSRRDDRIITLERTKLPPGLNPSVGQRLELTQTDDQRILVTVSAVTDTTLTLDANHPLAGKELTFDIELLTIVQP